MHKTYIQHIISNIHQIFTNVSLAHYIAGLGYKGLGNKAKAREEFNAALASSPDYLNAMIALSQLEFIN